MSRRRFPAELRRSFTRLSVILLVMAVFAPGVRAQSEDGSTEQASAALDQSTAARELLADQLAVLMHQTLDGQGEPRSDQLQRAQVLLDMALTLAPKDAERWRLRAELAQRMGDASGRQDALRHYVSLRPKDDAAQLQFIETHLQALQTLDARVDRIERMLQSRSSRQLSRSLRSRLATFAAQAANELGDTDRFVRWLQQALTLDPANAEATATTYQLALERGANMGQLGVAAVNHVAAAPASPSARVDLADVLVSQAVYGRAAQQYEMARTLARGALPTDAYANWALCRAALGENEAALALLANLAQPQQGNGAAGDDAAGDGSAALPVALELLRLAIYESVAGRDVSAERSFESVKQQLSDRIAQSTDSDDNQANTATQPTDAALHAAADLAWARLLFDREIERAAVAVEQIETKGDEAVASRLPRLRAWLALRRGQREEARRMFTEQQDSDPFASLGLAELAETPEARRQRLERALEQSPGTLAGLLAARRLRAENVPLTATRTGRLLIARMDDYPSNLWQPALSISPWAEIDISVEPGSVRYLEPLRAELTLRNASRMPLNLSTGQGIPTRVLLSVSPSAGGERLAQPVQLVVDVDRRLTLGVDEQFTIETRLDRAELGALLAGMPHQTVMLNVSAILGPRPSQRGGFTAEPAGDMARARAVEVRGQAVEQAQLTQWLTAARQGDATTRMRALARVAQIVDTLPANLDNAQMRSRIGETVSDVFSDIGPVGQAWVARFLPANQTARDVFRRVFNQLERNEVPMVRVVYLARHVTDADDPVLTASLRHDNATIRAFAEAVRRGLQADTEESETQP